MIRVIKGDVTQTPVEAIGVLNNPLGNWFGGVDQAIQKVAGQQYHDQVRQAIAAGQFTNAQVLVAHQITAHAGQFTDIIFCCDDLDRRWPVYQLVFRVLMKAKEAGYKSIALPVFRTGYAVGLFPNIRETVAGISQAVKDFQSVEPDLEITIVIYDDPEAQRLLEASFD